MTVVHGDPVPPIGRSLPRSGAGANGNAMADADTDISAIYTLVQRSHDGGHMVSWKRDAELETVQVGQPVAENDTVVGVCVAGPTPEHAGSVLYTVQCSGICTVAAGFTDVKRGKAPYAWLHQPVWYQPSDSKAGITLRATGSREERWSRPDGAVLVGWALGFDIVNWGVLVRVQLATAAPPLP